MTDQVTEIPDTALGGTDRLKRRHRSEKLFRLLGISAIFVATLVLVVLMGTMIEKGASTLVQSRIALTVELEKSRIDPNDTRDPEIIGQASFGGITKRAIRRQFPDVKSRRDKKALYKIYSRSSLEVRGFCNTILRKLARQ